LTSIRVFFLTEESVKIMDLCGRFQTFLTAPAAAELAFVAVRMIVRFIPPGDFLLTLRIIDGVSELKPLP
jgi:hypothetical protein